jgi:hypothetical protein
MLPYRLGLCATLLLCLQVGCYKNPYAPGTITGTVTYKNEPVPGGTVTFHIPGKGPYAGVLQTNGTYEVTDVPTGEGVKVTIDTEYLNPKRKVKDYSGGKGAKVDAAMKAYREKIQAPAKESVTGVYRQIPTKYGSTKGTPLTVTIEAGSQPHNFTLTD